MTLNDNWYGRFLTPALLLAAGALVVPACSSDTNKQAGGSDAGAGGTPGAGGSAGTGTGGHSSGGASGSGTGGASGSGTGGTSGSGTGGTRNSGGEADASVDGSTPDSSTPPPAPSDDAGPSPVSTLCAGDPGPDAGAASHIVLVAGTDFKTKTETAAVDLGRGCVLGRSTFADGDAIAAASAGRGFVIERTNAALDVLSAAGNVEGRVALHGDDADPGFYLDPHAIVLPGKGATKGYVSLYGGDGIAVVDLTGKTVTHVIDLASLVDPSDSDHSADPDGGFYDPTTGRVYFVLARIDVNTVAAPNYQLACPKTPGMLVAIDPSTDSLVDLNGGTDGVGVPLELVGPSGLAFDSANHRVLIASSGCYAGPDGGAVNGRNGVEAVNLDTFATNVVYAAPSTDFVNRLVLIGSNSGALDTYDAVFTEHWTRLNTSTGVLGSELANVPDAVVAESPGSLVGVTVVDGVRAEVVRYDVATQTSTVVTERPWANLLTSAGNSALVR